MGRELLGARVGSGALVGMVLPFWMWVLWYSVFSDDSLDNVHDLGRRITGTRDHYPSTGSFRAVR